MLLYLYWPNYTPGKLQPFAKYTISLFISLQGDIAKTLLLLTLVLTGIGKRILPVYMLVKVMLCKQSVSWLDKLYCPHRKVRKVRVQVLEPIVLIWFDDRAGVQWRKLMRVDYTCHGLTQTGWGP